MKKNLVVPLFLMVSLGIVCWVAMHLIGINYPTVACLAAGNCLIPGSTPLWMVGASMFTFTVITAGAIALAYKLKS